LGDKTLPNLIPVRYDGKRSDLEEIAKTTQALLLREAKHQMPTGILTFAVFRRFALESQVVVPRAVARAVELLEGPPQVSPAFGASAEVSRIIRRSFTIPALPISAASSSADTQQPDQPLEDDSTEPSVSSSEDDELDASERVAGVLESKATDHVRWIYSTKAPNSVFHILEPENSLVDDCRFASDIVAPYEEGVGLVQLFAASSRRCCKDCAKRCDHDIVSALIAHDRII